MKIWNLIKRNYSFDDRSLALYRFLLGILVIMDVLLRLGDVNNFYTDFGVLPRAQFLSDLAQPWTLSFHLANGTAHFQFILFAIHFIFGLMLMFGFKTTLATLGSFLMTASLHNRNWLINNGGDDIFRAILFISVFLPLGRCFSIDSALKEKQDQLNEFQSFSVWNLAFIFQVFAIYFVSYILKDHPIWRKDFTAVHFASRLDIFATPLSVWLRQFWGFQKAVTIFTIYLEWLGPLLLILSPLFGKRWWYVRMLTIALFWALHWGIICTMWIGLFPYICLVMWLIFIPSEIWEYLNRKFSTEKRTIYFDGRCGFCKKMVFILINFLALKKVTVLEAQSNPEILKVMEENNSWVVKNEHGQKFCHFKAFIELLQSSHLFSWSIPFFKLKPISFLGHHLYVWISYHRSLMGLMTQYFDFKKEKKTIPLIYWMKELAGFFVLATLVTWNLTTIKKWNIKAPFFQSIIRELHLYQEWNMFSPFPKTDNIWIEVPATFRDGSQRELITGDLDIYSIKSDAFVKSIPNEHWRKFYLSLSDHNEYHKYFGGYLCRRWNQTKPRPVPENELKTFEIIVYSQQNLVNRDKGGIIKKMSWTHWCFDEDLKKAQNNHLK